MIVSSQLLANVKQAEGCRLTAYRDTLGFWTVGVGHKLADGKDWSGYTITPDTANGLLIVDLNTALGLTIALPEWPALDTPARQDGLIEIIYNMGVGGWRKFVNTRAAITDKNWKGVHDGLLTSLWATQVHGRAIRIAMQMYTGNYV